MTDDELDALVKRLRAKRCPAGLTRTEPGVLELTYKDDPLTTEAADAIDALRSPPADVGEAIDADDIQQAMSDVFSEGGSVRDAAVYVKACIDRALAETTKGDDPSTET